MPPKKQADAYVALVGLTYPTASGEVSVKPGEVVTDLPDKSVGWLTKQGLIAAKDTTGKEA